VALRRGAPLILILLLVAVVVSATGLAVLYFLVGGEPSVAPGTTLVVRLSGSLDEGGPSDVFGGLLPVARTPSVRTVADALNRARTDSRIRALLVVPSGLSSPYWAKLQEVRDAIVDFKRSGKPAYGFLEYGGQAEYFVASACDRVYLLPTSVLDLTGLASYELFLRGTPDKIGAYPDMVPVGEYKAAANQLTEKTFTPAHREMAVSLNGDLFGQLVRAVADGRKRPDREVLTLVDEGPFLPEDALRAGLVDELAYEDEVQDALEEAADASHTIDLPQYARTGRSAFGFAPRFALVYATGTITSGRSGFDPLAGATVGSETLVEHLREIRQDASIRAVVLRVDSPGGSAVASDVIWRELTLLRDAEPKRPLIVSMSDLAASGGYYIAMAAPTIVAEPGTLTGSIGIFGGKVALGGTYGKLGATIEEVASGRFAAMNSPARPYTPEERAFILDRLQYFYRLFLGAVGQGRSDIRLYWSATERQVTLNGQRIRRLADYLGAVRVVVFCTEDLLLVKGPGSRRRRFLDLLLSQTAPAYLPLLQRYMHAVRSRNALLKHRAVDEAAIESFTQEVVAAGTEIMRWRRELTPRLSPLVRLAYRRIAHAAEELRLEYQPSVKGDFAVELAQARARERAFRMTVCGPHRDELRLLLDDKPAAQFGSEGQKRTLAIALKMAQAEYLTGLHGAPPILLIDDVMGELDSARRSGFLPLLERSHEAAGQVFMTCTEQNWPRELGRQLQRWDVKAGALNAGSDRT